MTDPPPDTPQTDAPADDAEWLDAVRIDGRLQIRVPLRAMPWTFTRGGKQELMLEVDGEPRTLKVVIPPGTQPGQVLRLRDVPLGNERADIYVELQGVAFKNPQQALAILAGAIACAGAIVAYLLSSAAAG